MTVIFVGLMMAMIAVIWGINKWYLEKYYITEKVESIEAAYDAFNWQLESNAERGISIQEAMKREQDADGNIKEGNLQKLFRDFSDKANVSHADDRQQRRFIGSLFHSQGREIFKGPDGAVYFWKKPYGCKGAGGE